MALPLRAGPSASRALVLAATRQCAHATAMPMPMPMALSTPTPTPMSTPMSMPLPMAMSMARQPPRHPVFETSQKRLLRRLKNMPLPMPVSRARQPPRNSLQGHSLRPPPSLSLRSSSAQAPASCQLEPAICRLSIGATRRGLALSRGVHVATTAAASAATAAATEGQAEEAPVRETPNLLDVMRERGLVDAVTSEDLRHAGRSPLKVYVGFDPTAESLHLGNLLGIIALAWVVRCGHTAVALLGGATARVGDPSGKSVERPVLDEATIAANTQGIQNILENILRRQEAAGGGSGRVLIMNNFEWWKDVTLLAFLRDVGKAARVGTMIAKESVRKRLSSDEGMSFTEFTYQLLQGYDFVHLFQKHRVTVQMGGSDQWGNITAGTDLIRRLEAAQQTNVPAAGTGAEEEGEKDRASEGGRPQVFGLTWPLLLKSDGSKFGKSESGAVWLAPSSLSPYKFYQYMFNTPDADVVRFLQMLTFLDMSQVQAIEASMAQEGYIPNTAQRRLAEEVTRFVHGEEGLQEALRATQALAPGAQTALDVATLEAIAEDVPSVTLSLEQVLSAALIDVAAASGIVASKGAARRLVKQGGLYLNNSKVDAEDRIVCSEDLVGGKMLLLAAGKKNKMIVRILS